MSTLSAVKFTSVSELIDSTKLGAPKLEAGERTIPLLPMVANTLREWKLACPKGELDLAFPQRARPGREHLQHCPAGAASDSDRRRRHRQARQGEVHRSTRPAPLLRQLVHQPPRRRWPRAAAQAGAGPPWPRLNPDDGGSLRPSFFPRGNDGAELAAAEKAFLGQRARGGHGQRAMVAAKLATLQDGQRQVGKFADVPTQAEAAANQRGPGRAITG
jgi:hypothetical protein